MPKKIEILGKKFNKWRVLNEHDIRGKSKEILYRCECDCGTIRLVDGKSLRKGRSKSCKPCSQKETMSPLSARTKLLMLSKKWGQRTIIEEISTDYYKVKCDCERIGKVRGATLREGRALMCGGCAKNDSHGLSKHPMYKAWAGMRQRCQNPNNSEYRNYGARGIKVCPRWQSFDNFKDDMGDRPDGMQLDRIDPDGDYEPNNCKWSTPKENLDNRRMGILNRDKYIYIRKELLCYPCLSKTCPNQVSTTHNLRKIN